MTTECVRPICSLRAHCARRLGLWGGGGGAVGHTWCGPHTPPTAVGSHQSGNWGMVRYARRSASNPPPLCKIDFMTRPWGTYIYTRRGRPHTGVNLRDNRPCEANRERLSLSQLTAAAALLLQLLTDFQQM